MCLVWDLKLQWKTITSQETPAFQSCNVFFLKMKLFATILIINLFHSSLKLKCKTFSASTLWIERICFSFVIYDNEDSLGFGIMDWCKKSQSSNIDHFIIFNWLLKSLSAALMSSTFLPKKYHPLEIWMMWQRKPEQINTKPTLCNLHINYLQCSWDNAPSPACTRLGTKLSDLQYIFLKTTYMLLNWMLHFLVLYSKMWKMCVLLEWVGVRTLGTWLKLVASRMYRRSLRMRSPW